MQPGFAGGNPSGMAGANLIVFRDTAEAVSGPELGRRLLRATANINSHDQSSIVEALVLAGEVECALSDCAQNSAAKAVELTDVVASLFVRIPSAKERDLQALAAETADDLPDTVRISHPEGFAYYALHPGDFADAVATSDNSGAVGVVGIRSVGTTLSAVAAAALRRRGVKASRITVRPSGHPYNRTTELDEHQRAWVREQHYNGARILVVDEGPGLSGSSFLSVGESLVREGIRAEWITFMGTRDVDAGQLCTANARSRWEGFGWRRASSRISTRFQGSISLSGGVWRELFLPDRVEQPACWPEMDGVKYLSPDRKHVFKFEGFGESGRQIRERAKVLSEAGFGPRLEDADDGMSRYEFIAGRPLARSYISTEVLDRMAEYCAFRASEFRIACAADRQLEDMVRFNFSQETGRECPVPAGSLEPDCRVIADCRMFPHEWIRCVDGRSIKVDGSRHGDDHFLPGPTDIAWDLAGAIVEWNMDHEAEQYLLRRFRAKSGIVPDKLQAYVLTYCVFRASYCKMALMGTAVDAEKARLERAHHFYRAKIDELARQLDTAEVI